MIDLSVVIPCYNEGKNILRIIKKIENINKLETTKKIEYILINNGSTDETIFIFEKISISNIKIINLKKNIGYGHGIMSGLSIAKGQIVSWTHGDIQCDLYDVVRCYKKYKKELFKNNLLLKGKRINRAFIDNFFSKCMAIIASIIFNQKFSEINAQPKIFNKKLLKYFNNAPDDFSLDLYLIYVANLNNYQINEYPVKYKKRLFGVSKGGDTLIGKIKLTIKTFSYMLKLKKILNDSNYTPH